MQNIKIEQPQNICSGTVNNITNSLQYLKKCDIIYEDFIKGGCEMVVSYKKDCCFSQKLKYGV